MTEEQIQSYIDGFVKEAMAQGLNQAQAVELMMKIANNTDIQYPDDQLVDVD